MLVYLRRLRKQVEGSQAGILGEARHPGNRDHLPFHPSVAVEAEGRLQYPAKADRP